MWLCKLKLKHDCVVGKRCIKFKCKSVGYPLESYLEEGVLFFRHLEKVIGGDVDGFVNDLSKDKNVKNLELNGNLVFFSYKTENITKMPSNIHMKKVIFTKPVVVNEDGYESWEVVSWDRDIINDFIEKVRDEAFGLDYFKIEKITKSDLTEMYFPKVMPELSKEQSRAISLAIQKGYYGYPRKAELKDLAARMKVSLSTYREHLRKAEKKVMPLLI